MDSSKEQDLPLEYRSMPLAFDKCETCCRTDKCLGSEKQFLKAVSIWINKPHVVNRRLTGSKILTLVHCETADQILMTLQNRLETSTRNALQCQEDTAFDLDLSEESSPFLVILRELIPKSEHFPVLVEASVYDKIAKKVTFIPCGGSWKTSEANKLTTKEVTYCVQFHCNSYGVSEEEGNRITISWKCNHKEKVESRRQLTSCWLQSVLLDKLISWSQVQDVHTSPISLKLVTVDRYKDVYLHLKNKYGKDLVKNWTERTDPKKYVYEDIAIAAYLMLIWEEDCRKKGLLKKQSFVDLGCGNGLLVYILTKEGYKGLGIDLKKRKTWDTFGDCVELKVKSITPSADALFPEYDWIIGNHSDELTPWIPVIAARSSYHCNFFVLPCCHHDFVGKFGRPEKGKSQYSSYLQYIEQVIRECGFYPEQDVLRIPSTKRTSFIGRKRSYEPKDEVSMDESRQRFIENQINRLCNKVKQTLIVSAMQTSHGVSKVKNSDESISRTATKGDKNVEAHGPTGKRNFDNFANSLESLETDTFCTVGIGSSDQSEPPKPIPHPHLKVKCAKRDVANAEEEKPVSLHHQTSGIPSLRSHSSGKSTTSWAPNFQARAEQRNRNCQRVPEAVKWNIVETVFQLVLNANRSSCDSSQAIGEWRKGGVVPINKAVQQFERCVLAELKSECGGFQTLLRNHSHIFQVTKGKIELRDFTKADPWEGQNPHKAKGKKKDTFKTTLCWFFDHHPDGCPRGRKTCLFAHGKDDLREKKSF